VPGAWEGGGKSVTCGTIVLLPGRSVTLDGKTFVERGELKP
jgi:hypothetical protein